MVSSNDPGLKSRELMRLRYVGCETDAIYAYPTDNSANSIDSIGWLGYEDSIVWDSSPEYPFQLHDLFALSRRLHSMFEDIQTTI